MVLNRKRKILFRFASVALAVLPFLIAEVWLRLATPQKTADLSWDPVFDTSAQTPLFQLDESGEQYRIDPSRMNFFRPAIFQANKPSDLRRVFVLGGSTVQGRPYETETAFSQWAKLRLQAADPTKQWDVVNCGGVSYASYRVALILQEVLQYQPDAIVLYCGHNEFLEERSYHTLSASPFDSLASGSRLVGAIRNSFRGHAKPQERLSSDAQTRLDLTEGMKRYVRDDAWRDAVQSHYLSTMRRMIKACQDAHVPLIVYIPTSEIVVTPPFKTMIASGIDEANFQKHWTIVTDIQLPDDQRLRACEACLKIDPQHAGVHFIAGTLHWKRQRSEQARRHFTAARDHDVCPLRATTEMIEGLQQLLSELQVNSIDCPQLFDQVDSQRRPLPDGIPDPDRFADHIHPTIAGHQMLGVSLAEELSELFRLNADPQIESRYQQLIHEHLQSLDETYYGRAKQRLEGLKNWAAGRAGKLAL